MNSIDHSALSLGLIQRHIQYRNMQGVLECLNLKWQLLEFSDDLNANIVQADKHFIDTLVDSVSKLKLSDDESSFIFSEAQIYLLDHKQRCNMVKMVVEAKILEQFNTPITITVTTGMKFIGQPK